MLPSFDMNVGVDQGSAFLPILSALYFLPFLYILENRLKILKIPISILFFIDDGLLIVQSKSLLLSNSLLFYSYNIKFSISLDRKAHFTSFHSTYSLLAVLSFALRISRST